MNNVDVDDYGKDRRRALRIYHKNRIKNKRPIKVRSRDWKCFELRDAKRMKTREILEYYGEL